MYPIVIIIILVYINSVIGGDSSHLTGGACAPDQPLRLILGDEDHQANLSSYRDPETGLYPPNSKCSWLIVAPERGVEVTGSPSAVLCGKTPPNDVISDSDALVLVFYSDNVRQFKGFDLIYSVYREKEPCANDETRCKNDKCVLKEKICNNADDCEDGSDEEKCPEFRPQKTKCGRPKIKPDLSEEKIVGGTLAVPGSWPWQTLRDEEPYGHRCGGSVIDSQWIVTAAHCFNGERNTSKWFVKMGKYNKIERDEGERTRYLEKLFIHPGYVSPFDKKVVAVQDKSHDIALIKMNAPLTFDDRVSPVCLANFKRAKKGSRFVVTGWGETMGSGYETVLKQAVVPVVTNKECQKRYEGQYRITGDMICAGYRAGGVDACKGDSGGPLVTLKSDRWYLSGVVSFGGDCGKPDQPGVYVNVRNYVKWIKKTLKKNK